MRIRGYFSKPKGVGEKKKSLGNTVFVGTVTRPGLEQRRIVLDYRSVGTRDFSPLLGVQTGSGEHPDSCSTGTEIEWPYRKAG